MDGEETVPVSDEVARRLWHEHETKQLTQMRVVKTRTFKRNFNKTDRTMMDNVPHFSKPRLCSAGLCIPIIYKNQCFTPPHDEP